ncbi:MAG: ABC transporter permease, partial [Steroidobacteraceae bacterium]
ISYGLWQRKFGGNPKIVGTALSLGNEPYTILGVIGQQFPSDPPADIWLPFQIDPNSTNQGHFFLTAARLRPGVSLAQANAQMKLAYGEFRRRWTLANPKDSFGVQPLRDSIVGDSRRSLLVLLGAVGFVLLIACANVANLLLVRATGRKREFAIRAAMGAGRIRIIRQLLTESIVLALTGGILGLIVGYVGVRALFTIGTADLPLVGENGASVGLDWRVLLFTLGVALLTGILFGLAPALGASRPDLNTTLKESSNRSGTGFRHNITRSLLVVSEVSLALVLLIGAALLIRTFIALHHVNPGFDAHDVLTMEMSLTGDRFQKTSNLAQLALEGRQRVNAIPGIESSASTCCLPLEGGFGLPFDIVGRPHGKDPNTGGAGWMNTSPGYFATFHIPIRGRDFTDQDTGAAPLVVIINEAMAKKWWPKQDPIGQLIVIGKNVGPQFEEGPRQIIGVAGDIRDGGLNRDPRELMIVPQAQVTDGLTALNAGFSPMAWIVRTHGDPHQYISAVTEQLRQASGGFPVARVRPMEEVVSNSTARENFNMLLLTIFGASALVLAAIGIYGLMAYSVQQRTQEIGIRMALGADRARIRSLVVWNGMRLAIVGVVIGIGAAFGLTRFIASFLFGVKTWDPFVFVTVPVVLSAVALLAVWMPASRASRLEPHRALRIE